MPTGVGAGGWVGGRGRVRRWGGWVMGRGCGGLGGGGSGGERCIGSLTRNRRGLLLPGRLGGYPFRVTSRRLTPPVWGGRKPPAPPYPPSPPSHELIGEMVRDFALFCWTLCAGGAVTTARLQMPGAIDPWLQHLQRMPGTRARSAEVRGRG